MKTFARVLVGTLLLLLIVNVLWLNNQVVKLGQLGKVAADKLIEIEEQLTFLAFQQEKKAEPITALGGEEQPAELKKTPTVVEPVATIVSRRTMPSEVFIPLGSGSTSSTEWVDTGAQAYVDSSIYPNVQEVYLQASLRSNSGMVFARVGAFEISHDTPTATFKTSAPLSLASGNRLYVVQLRSETGQEVFLENARLRLVLK